MAIKPPGPLDPPPAEPADVSALAALRLGTADPDQQRRAIDWILRQACRLESTTFSTDPHVAAFNQGRRQAGLHIRHAMQTTPAAAAALNERQGRE